MSMAAFSKSRPDKKMRAIHGGPDQTRSGQLPQTIVRAGLAPDDASSTATTEMPQPPPLGLAIQRPLKIFLCSTADLSSDWPASPIRSNRPR